MFRTRFFTGIRQTLQDWWHNRSRSTQSLPGHIWQAVKNYISWGTGSRQAAALSYYAIFSVFPLVLLIAVAISTVLGPAIAQEQILNGIALFVPIETSEAIRGLLEIALEQRAEFGLVAVIGLVWSATGLFSNITLSLDSIFQVPALRSIWRQRLLALLMGIMLVILVGASFLTSGVLRLISALLLDRPNIWITIGTLFLPLGLNIVIFALLFRYVPARYVYWDAVWPAAMFGAVGWEVAKGAFDWYLSNVANLSVVYGGIATVIALLFWAYLIAGIFLFSAELCARLNDWIIANAQRQAEELERKRIAIYFGSESPYYMLSESRALEQGDSSE